MKSITEKAQVPDDIRGEIVDLIENNVQQSLTFIKRGTSKMDQLLTGLLRLSRLGRAALKVELLNMDEMMGDVVSSFEYQLEKSGVELSIESVPN